MSMHRSPIERDTGEVHNEFFYRSLALFPALGGSVPGWPAARFATGWIESLVKMPSTSDAGGG